MLPGKLNSNALALKRMGREDQVKRSISLQTYQYLSRANWQAVTFLSIPCITPALHLAEIESGRRDDQQGVNSPVKWSKSANDRAGSLKINFPLPPCSRSGFDPGTVHQRR